MAARKKYTPQPRREDKKSGLYWILITGVVFMVMLGSVSVRTESIHARIHTSQIQAELTKSLAYQKALLLEIQRLKSSDRIMQIAQSRLNLVREASRNTVYLPREGH